MLHTPTTTYFLSPLSHLPQPSLNVLCFCTIPWHCISCAICLLFSYFPFPTIRVFLPNSAQEPSLSQAPSYSFCHAPKELSQNSIIAVNPRRLWELRGQSFPYFCLLSQHLDKAWHVDIQWISDERLEWGLLTLPCTFDDKKQEGESPSGHDISGSEELWF